MAHADGVFVVKRIVHPLFRGVLWETHSHGSKSTHHCPTRFWWSSFICINMNKGVSLGKPHPGTGNLIQLFPLLNYQLSHKLMTPYQSHYCTHWSPILQSMIPQPNSWPWIKDSDSATSHQLTKVRNLTSGWHLLWPNQHPNGTSRDSASPSVLLQYFVSNPNDAPSSPQLCISGDPGEPWFTSKLQSVS